MKTMTLTLIPISPVPPKDTPDFYRITKATDTIEYTPGNTLCRVSVESLCRSNRWKVSIIEPRQAV